MAPGNWRLANSVQIRHQGTRYWGNSAAETPPQRPYGADTQTDTYLATGGGGGWVQEKMGNKKQSAPFYYCQGPVISYGELGGGGYKMGNLRFRNLLRPPKTGLIF